MRIEVGGVGINPDGSLALRPHPGTGALRPVFAYDCAVYLDGEPCSCRMADEEAGLVEVFAEPEGENIRPCDALGRPLTEFRRGKVEIRFDPHAPAWDGEWIEERLERLRKEHQAVQWARTRAGIEAWERGRREYWQQHPLPSPFTVGTR